MKKLLKAFCYRRSENDRDILKGLLALGCAIAAVLGVIVLVEVWTARNDSAKLDAILANQKIDAIGFVSWNETNIIRGEEALKLLASLHKTNRVANIDWTKQQAYSVRLLNGTNEICWFSVGEDGAWEFGAYGFRTRR